MSHKIRIEVEIPFHASPSLLYQYISTPSGLSEWFADNVNSRGEIFSFFWDDEVQKAKLTSKKTNERVKFKWLDEDDNETEYYFELKILEDDITKDVSLLVVDFSEEDEIEETKQLWLNQVNDLKHTLGSI